MVDVTDLSVRSQSRCFGGVQGFYSHRSSLCNGGMNLAVFTPPQAQDGPVPVLTYLSGLTCTEENVTIKAGAQRLCAELGLMFVAPDTSPRNQEIPGEEDSYNLGTGAGFYVDATRDPWAKAYKMYSYITVELPQVIEANFPADRERQGITGHSMGGHGAITLHLRHPKTYKSVSAFSPICNPIESPWGQKLFKAYLGNEKKAWREHDACELVRRQPSDARILVDQGAADEFLETNLMPDRLASACAEAGQALELRLQPGYDHSYYFIQSFMEDHLRHHAAALMA